MSRDSFSEIIDNVLIQKLDSQVMAQHCLMWPLEKQRRFARVRSAHMALYHI